MNVVRMCARSLGRRKLAGSLAAALLVAVAGGVVLAALAGARRTDSAYPRLLDRLHSADVVMLPRQFEALDVEKIAHLPNVVQTASLLGYGLVGRNPDGSINHDVGAGMGASADGVGLYDIERFRILDGRMPNPARSDEVLVNQAAARLLHLKTGSVFHGALFNLTEFSNAPEGLSGAELAAYFAPVDLRVTGIGRSVDELLANENQDQDLIVSTPAFARLHRHELSYALAGVRLRHGSRDVAEFEQAVGRAFPDVQFQFTTRAGREETFANAVRPYVDSLRLFTAVAALAGLFVVVQALVRLVGSDSADGATLDALGATRAQRASISLARAALVAVAGALLAVALALATSSLFPIGPARAAEADPGVRVDPTVVVGGFIAIVVLLVVPSAVVAWRLARRARLDITGARAWRPSRAVERLAAAGAPAPVVTGVRFAVQRDRRPGAPSLATTLVGLVAAIATVVGALTFGSTLNRLVTTPARYGWNWDAMIDTYDSGASPGLIKKVTADRDLSGVTVGSRGNVTIAGQALSAFGFDARRGEVLPVATSGRFPKAPGEVALGAKTLRDLNRSVSDSISARTAGGKETHLRIVGRTLLPSLSLNGTFGLGEGVALTTAGLRRLDPGADPSFFVVDLKPGVRRATINRRYGALGPQRPGDIQAYERVRATPLILAGLLAFLGVGVLAHMLVTSIRSRRRDLAILKTIGFSRRQVAVAVAWQATTLAGIALALAIPIGLVFGRWTWRAFADDLGVAADVAFPILILGAVSVTALLLANLIAALPAHAGARTRPAVVLRSE